MVLFHSMALGILRDNRSLFLNNVRKQEVIREQLVLVRTVSCERYSNLGTNTVLLIYSSCLSVICFVLRQAVAVIISCLHMLTTVVELCEREIQTPRYLIDSLYGTSLTGWSGNASKVTLVGGGGPRDIGLAQVESKTAFL